MVFLCAGKNDRDDEMRQGSFNFKKKNKIATKLSNVFL